MSIARFDSWPESPDPAEGSPLECAPEHGTRNPAVSAPYAAAIQAHVEQDWPQLLGLRMVESGNTLWINTDVWFGDSDPRHTTFHQSKELIREPVLDVGAGGGRAALELQEEGIDVTAIDCEPACVAALKRRGVKKVELADITTYRPPEKFRTILFLDSTFGLTGNLDDAGSLLDHLRHLLTDDGCILVQDLDRSVDVHAFQAQFVYRNQVGEPFQWLNYSFGGLRNIAAKHGWSAEKVVYGPGAYYMAVLKVGPASKHPPRSRTFMLIMAALLIVLLIAVLANVR